jgi:hypothetical protein
VHFLGFRFHCKTGRDGGDVAIHPSAKAERRLRTTLRKMTPPNWERRYITARPTPFTRRAKVTLDQAFRENLERFVKKPPVPPAKPTATWINPPTPKNKPPACHFRPSSSVARLLPFLRHYCVTRIDSLNRLLLHASWAGSTATRYVTLCGTQARRSPAPRTSGLHQPPQRPYLRPIRGYASDRAKTGPGNQECRY